VSKEVKKAVKSGGYEAEFSLRVHSLCLRLQNDGQVKDVLSKSVEVLAAGKKAQKAFLKGQLDSMPIPSASTMTRVRLSLDLAHMRLRRRAHSDMDYLQNACRNVFLDSSPMKGWDWLRVVVCKPLQGASKTKKKLAEFFIHRGAAGQLAEGWRCFVTWCLQRLIIQQNPLDKQFDGGPQESQRENQRENQRKATGESTGESLGDPMGGHSLWSGRQAGCHRIGSIITLVICVLFASRA
jgi:hypothetical protein